LRVVTAEEMRHLDAQTIDQLGIPSLVLMETAGVGAVRRMEEQYGSMAGRRVDILVGAGNNGGDGLVAARHLLNRGAGVKVYMLGTENKLSPDCRHNLTLYKKLQGDLHWLTERSLPKLRLGLRLSDFIVDAMLGTGAKGALRGLYAQAVQLVNQAKAPVVALDVPTGVNADSGDVIKSAVQADLTVSFGFIKQGLLLHPGAGYAGRWVVEDIGIPDTLAKHIRCFRPDGSWLQRHLPQRPAWGHKGTFGHGLVVAGSRSMAGSAFLTAQGMLRSGAGLVTVAVPESIAGWYPPGELLVVPLPETEEGTLSRSSLEPLQELLQGKQALVVGPGLSQREAIPDIVMGLLQSWQQPAVIDADAVNCLQGQDQWLEALPKKQRQQWILTPHPGEMARLTGSDAGTINRQRRKAATEGQKRLGTVLLLKGAPTFTVGPESMYINSTGNAGMGSAGMGDVLSGIIGALLCQGMEPVYAAAAGAYVHGWAGDLAKERLGERGLTASDLLRELPYTLQ